MSTDIRIRTRKLGKCYQMYDRPVDRLKQALWRGRRQFYKEFWALRDISLEIRQGETIGIIGSNGSGKSTLLQLICGTLHPTGGEIEINGRVAALLDLGAGFNPEFTGRENVYVKGAIQGLTRAEIDKRYDAIVAFADIGGFIDQPVKIYSSGMYVRLAFATAVNVSPDILLVDEALAVGDARFQQKCMARIREFCRSGTVILVTHDMGAVTELCSRAFWIERGGLKLEGAPKIVVEKYLEYMYEGERDPEEAPAAISKSAVVSREMKGFTPVGKDIGQFGDRRITIESVGLISRGGDNGIVYAGRPCEIGAVLCAHEDIREPIVGYIVKDRLGREILGDNTALLRQDLHPLEAEQYYVILFQIDAWPNFLEGEYSLTIGVADGRLNDHVQCHYLHDVLIFMNIPLRMPGGIFSVVDTNVTLSRADD